MSVTVKSGGSVSGVKGGLSQDSDSRYPGFISGCVRTAGSLKVCFDT